MSANFSILSSPRYDTDTSKWHVDEKDTSGNVVKSLPFAGKKEADEYIKGIVIKNKIPGTGPKEKKVSPQMKKQIETANFLEDSLNNLGLADAQLPAAITTESVSSPPMLPVEMGLEELEAERKRKIEEFNTKWEEKQTLFRNKAENLVNSIADLYFDADVIKRQEMIRYKKEMESADVLALLQQMDVAESAIKKLNEIIELGQPSSRIFEVLAGMQKTVLEIVQTKRKFLKDVADDFRLLKEEIMLLEAASETDTSASGDSSNRIAMSTHSTTMVIKQIQTFIQQSKTELTEYQTIPSKNSNLVKETDNLNYIEEAQMVEQDDKPQEALKYKKKGLDTWDESDDG